MTTYRDLFIRFLLFIACWSSGLFLMGLDGIQKTIPLSFPAIILPIFGYFILLKILKDKKRSGTLLENDLANLGYSIISERPLTIKEQYENYEMDFGFNYLEGINTNSLLYKAKMLRHFLVKNENNYEFELIITVVQTWRDKIIYKIISTKRVRD